MPTSIEFEPKKLHIPILYLIIIVLAVLYITKSTSCNCEDSEDDKLAKILEAVDNQKNDDDKVEETEKEVVADEPEIECREDRDCSRLEICTNDKCEKVDCKVNSDCDDGSTCIDHECIFEAPEPECVEDSDCEENFMCDDGLCLEKEGELSVEITEVVPHLEVYSGTTKGKVDYITVTIKNEKSETFRLNDITFHVWGPSDESYKKDIVVKKITFTDVPNTYTTGNSQTFDVDISSWFFDELNEEKTIRAIVTSRDSGVNPIEILHKFRINQNE